MLRRNFLKSSAFGVTGAALGSPAIARAALQAENRAGAMPQKAYPPLPGPFRLPAEWYQTTTTRFQQQLAEKKLDGALVSDPNNINYLTGSFAVTTERPIWLFVPAKGQPSVFHPGLDRDLWGDWWVKDREWYFDYPHHGEFNQLVWTAGPKADLFQWMLNGLKKRGVKGGIGFEKRPSDDDLAAMKRTSPELKLDWQIVSPVLLHMREVKTQEELALDRVALSLHDRMMDFARDYIMSHGTDATDFEVAHATESFGASELTKYLKLTGKPHTGVGVHVGFECRTGVATAYPHPNQFFYERIKRGDALQIAAGVRIGGYGGEGYRAMQILSPDPLDPLRSKMWDVHTQMTLEQQKLMKTGTACNQVAAGVLNLARMTGLEKYVYHRPAHGEGSEGHQAPYLSLGDTTLLEENMTFSNEPGLYNPAGGFGYNHSNLVRVTKDGGEQMNRTPLTKDWCWIKI